MAHSSRQMQPSECQDVSSDRDGYDSSQIQGLDYAIKLSLNARKDAEESSASVSLTE